MNSKIKLVGRSCRRVAARVAVTSMVWASIFCAEARAASPNGVQIITKADPTGSFDAVSVPAAGGAAVRASRVFSLDGSQISTGNMPNWFVEGRAFLTSTRTGGTNPATISGFNTPCAYFDSSVDNNPDSGGFYTIDGYNTENVTSDVDQCAGTAASELNQLGMYIRLDRRFLGTNDKIQVIVSAKPIDAPNTAVTPSSCVTGGYFDASVCANQLFTISMRTSPGAATKPFFFLFPSAKAYDLISESVLLPIHVDSSITTITVDRVKGGAIFYNFKVIRLQ